MCVARLQCNSVTFVIIICCFVKNKSYGLRLFITESSIASRVNSSHAPSQSPPPSSEKDVHEQQQSIDSFWLLLLFHLPIQWFFCSAVCMGNLLFC